VKVAVFCSCSEGLSPLFFSEIEMLGEMLAEDGHQVVYGGASAGCMGALARGVLRRGGHLVGVVPEMDFMEGLVQPGLSERHVVPTLSSRKQAMNDLAEAFVVYPGGLGTLDEALEVLALKSCGNMQKPVIFYNFLGVWTPLLESLDLMVQQNLIRQPLDQLLTVLDKPEELRENLRNAAVGTAQQSATQLVDE
jgi:uncharacterized protein (TIGR00730 family)